jgi:hypothetical protein
MPSLRSFLLLSLWLLAAPNIAVAANTPSSKDAEAAIRAVRGDTKSSTQFEVSNVGSCFPSSRHNTLICLVTAVYKGNSSTEAVGFENTNSGWKAINPREIDISPICPNNKVATSLLQSVKRDKSIVVTGEVDSGKGDFSEERGLSRDKKGPMRLMCRFKVNDSLGEDRLYISYLSFENGQYTVDPDIEIWD